MAPREIGGLFASFFPQFRPEKEVSVAGLGRAADRISVSESIDHVLMAVFGGISGSAVADTSSIGSILIPMMTDSGYGKDFSVAVTVTSSCQGVMIPPSHNMILFAMAAMGN